MERRALVRLMGSAAAAWSLSGASPASARAGQIVRIGILETTSIASNAANLEAFRQSLSGLGYIEGQSFLIEYRSADGHPERFAELASELVRLKVDLIVARGAPAALAAKNA